MNNKKSDKIKKKLQPTICIYAVIYPALANTKTFLP